MFLYLIECKPPLPLLILMLVGYLIVICLCLRILLFEQTDSLIEQIKKALRIKG
jgi:hypothetical protein